MRRTRRFACCVLACLLGTSAGCGDDAIEYVPDANGGKPGVFELGYVQVCPVTATGLPLNRFGYFLNSRTQGLIPSPGGSLGILCLGGQIGRYVGPGQIKNSGATGSFSLALDLSVTPTPVGLVPIAAGEVWNFQAWYRDIVGPSTSNFTNGLQVVFL